MAETRFRPDVMLLAAGLGTRMRPITDDLPKPLVPVAGKPLIDWVVDEAVAQGHTRIVVNAHHLAPQIVAHVDALAAAHPGVSFSVSPEPDEALGTGGGVKAALPLLETDPILVMNTDAFWLPATDTPFDRMADKFSNTGAEIVLLCVHPRDATGFRRSHDFCLDPPGRITKDRGAPVIYAGVALLAKQAFAGAPDGAFSMNTMFEAAAARGTLFGVALHAPWLHVGDVEAIAEAEAVLERARSHA